MREIKASDDRIIVLSDGIFAIAITLLVLDIRIPDGLSQQNFNAALINKLLPKAVFYVITFLIIARNWISHRHLFQLLGRIDNIFLQLNLLFLALVAFFPAAAYIIEEYDYIGAVILYAAILAGCGYSMMFLWAYAAQKHLITDHTVSKRSINVHIFNAAIIPTLFLGSLLLLLIPSLDPSNVFFSWFCIPIILHLINHIYTIKQERSDDVPET